MEMSKKAWPIPDEALAILALRPVANQMFR